nr:MAG TPA: hypothetical protein [Caudoviricetes sp.]
MKTEARPGVYRPYSTSARAHLRTGKPPQYRERPGRGIGAGSAHWCPRRGRGRAAMNRATPKRSGVTPRRAGACSA